MTLEMGQVEAISPRELFKDRALVTDLQRNLIDDVDIFRGAGEQPPEDQGAGPTDCDHGRTRDRGPELSQELSDRGRAQVGHESILERGELDLAMAIADAIVRAWIRSRISQAFRLERYGSSEVPPPMCSSACQPSLINWRVRQSSTDWSRAVSIALASAAGSICGFASRSQSVSTAVARWNDA